MTFQIPNPFAYPWPWWQQLLTTLALILAVYTLVAFVIGNYFLWRARRRP